MDIELGMGLTDLPFDVPAYRAENCPAEAHVRIGWFRSVANIYQVFAASSFVDELAHAAGRDPLEYQLDLIGPGGVLDFKPDGVANYWNYGVPADKYPFDTRRLRRVLEVAAERAGWSKRSRAKGRGMGIVAARSFTSYVASVVEVEVDGQGRVRIPRVIQVVDAGTVVNPDRVRAQFEGAAVMGIGLAMTGEISAAARPDHADQLPHVPGAAHHRRAAPGRRAHRRERRASGRRRRARAAADRSGAGQRHLRGDGEARAGVADLEDATGVATRCAVHPLLVACERVTAMTFTWMRL